MSEKDNNILTPDFGAGRVEIKRSSFGDCRHTRVIVDPKLRRVTCRDCDEVLDPIEVIIQTANKERQYQYRREAVLELTRKIDELKKEEKRVKARLTRAKKKVGDG